MNWETIIIAILSSGVISALINQIGNYFSKRLEKKSGLNMGMRLIMKDRVRFLCIRYIEQGWVYEDELEDLMAMHSCYHNDLGGNGYLDELMRHVKALPIHGVGVK